MATGTDMRKQGTRPKTVMWPVAPDGFIPNSVVRSLAPYPRFRFHRKNQVKAQQDRDKTHDLKENWLLVKALLRRFCPHKEPQKQEDVKDSLEQDTQSEPEEANERASFNLPLPYRGGISETETKTAANLTPLRRVIPQTQHKLTRKDPSPVEEVQANASSGEELQEDPSVDEPHEDASVEQDLQTNDPAVEEPNNEEDDGNNILHLPENAPQSLCENSSAFPRKKAKKKSKTTSFKLPKTVTVRPKLQQEKKVSSIKEQTESFEASKTAHVPEFKSLKQHQRQRTDPPLKSPKVPVPPLLRDDRRPDSLLMYLYKRSKAGSAPCGVK